MAADQRILVEFGGMTGLGSSDLLVTTEDAADHAGSKAALVLSSAPAHAMGCRCCAGRDAWAEALSGWFVGATRGARPRFDRVLAVLDDRATARLKDLVEQDRFLAARFRLM